MIGQATNLVGANKILSKSASMFSIDMDKYQQIVTPLPETILPDYKIDMKELQKSLFDKKQMLLDLGISQNKPLRSAYMSVERAGKIYHIFDASQIPLGRLGARVAFLLQGKHKPNFQSSVGTGGDRCIIVNARDILVTGQKAKHRVVQYHTGFVGHLREIPYKFFMQQKPEQLIYYMVSKMLPKNTLRKQFLKNLEIYREPQHKYPNFLPNFRIIDQVDVKAYMGSYYDITQVLRDKQTEIIYSSNDIPQELQHLKYNPDKQITIDLDDRQKIFKMTEYNKKVVDVWAKYQQDLQRKIVFKFQAPKNRDPRVTGEDIFITKESQIKQYKLQHLIKENEPEQDDEILKNFKWQ